MGYTVPKDKEQQKQAIEQFCEGKNSDEKKKQFAYFLDIFLNGDENSFDEKICDDFYKFSRSFESVRNRINMKGILKDGTLSSFKDGFDRLWGELRWEVHRKESLKKESEEQKQQEMEERQQELDWIQSEIHEKAANKAEAEEKEKNKAVDVWTEMEKLRTETKDHFKELNETLNAIDNCIANIESAGNTSFANREKDRENTLKVSEVEQKKYENDYKEASSKIKSDYEDELEKTQSYLAALKNKQKKYPDEDIFDASFQEKIKEFEKNIEKAEFHDEYPDLNRELNNKYEKAFTEYDNSLELAGINVNEFKDKAKNQLSRMQEIQTELENKKVNLVDERKKQYEENGNTETPETIEYFVKHQDELNKEQKEIHKQLEELNKKIKDQVNEYNQIPDNEKKKLKKKQDDAYSDIKNEMGELNFVRVDPSAGYKPFGNVGEKKHLAASELRRIRGDMKAYYFELFKPMRQKREEISNTIENISNLTERKWYGAKKKEPLAFTDAKKAVLAYLRDKNDPNKAYKAYDECRNYLSGYMNADGKSLKSGSKVENMRNQGMLKILETMEKLPEFKGITSQKQINKAFHGFEILELEKDGKHTYTKLSFKELEASLAKDSVKKNSKNKNIAPVKKEKSIKDLTQSKKSPSSKL